MRKIILLLLVTFMILSVLACGNDTVNDYSTITPLPEVPQIPEVPPLPDEMPPPLHDTQDIEIQASTSEGDPGETFSEPTFEYSITWHGREISVGMRFFEVLDLGFEYSRRATEIGGFGVDAELAQEIAALTVNPGVLGLFYYISYGDYTLEIHLQNLSEEPLSIMETHVIRINNSTGMDGFLRPMGDVYYDGLLINCSTTLEDVQNRFGEGSVRVSANSLGLTYDQEGRGVRGRFVTFSFDVNTNYFISFIIQNEANPELSDAVWDGELRLPSYR